jgi:hypothetical protein
LSDNDIPIHVPTFNPTLDSHKVEHFSFEEIPSVLFLPVMNPPGILCSRPPWQHGVYRLWIHKLSADGAYSQGKLTDLFPPELDIIRFSQLLCKIA